MNLNRVRLIVATIGVGLIFFAAMADAASIHPLNQQRETHKQQIAQLKSEYRELADLAAIPIRPVRYNLPRRTPRDTAGQMAHEARVHAWKVRVYGTLIRQARQAYGNPGYLYRVQRRDGTRAMVEAAFTIREVPEWARSCFREIIRRESTWNPGAINDGPNTTASGLLQFLNTWGSLAERLDPVWSIERGIRYFKERGHFSPWIATAPAGCPTG